MHKDEKEPKETLGEKVKDKAHEIKEDLKEDADCLNNLPDCGDITQDYYD